jgi:organic radical activating enzyme
MKISLKCPKCGEDLELTANDDELRNALALSDPKNEVNNVVVIPTFRCGLNCPYCEYHQQPDNKSVVYIDQPYHVDKELDPSEWIWLLNIFAPAVYDFTGGEPLRYEGIAKVLNSLPRWAITSNTIHFTKDIDLSRCASWTASFHPHISAESQALFFKNIHYIKEQKVQIGVTLVATPDTIKQVLDWADIIHKDGFPVHIHPYYDDRQFSWYKYPEAAELLKKSPYLVYDEKLFEFKGIEGNDFCRGGNHYIAIGPDGKIFRCLTDLLHGRHSLRCFPDHDSQCKDKCFYPCDWKYGGRK